MKVFLISLLMGLTFACNNVTASPSTPVTFLCAGQPCDGANVYNGVNGSPCQSGCCWDGFCSVTACDAKQLEFATIGIIVASLAFTVIFGALYYMIYVRKAASNKQAKAAGARFNENW